MESYVYKKEVDWSLLLEGMTLPVNNQVIFSQTMGRFLQRGETKPITILFNGKSYPAKVININFDPKFKRSSDAVQIRYAKNGDLSKALIIEFSSSYNFILSKRLERKADEHQFIRLPENYKEYLAIYTTEQEDTYIFEAISLHDTQALIDVTQKWSECFLENVFDQDPDSRIIEQLLPQKIRKLNRKIGDNLKLLYDYHCQICGRKIGEEYGAHVAEAHHIDYFITSLNNDAPNIVIVCPNHHSIIHANNPIFDKSTATYSYENGFKEKLLLNQHIYM